MRKKRLFEWLLLAIGLLLLLRGTWSLGRYALFQAHPEWFSSPAAASAQRSDAFLPIARIREGSLDTLADLKVLGRLEIRRLGVSVLVVEGDDDKQLSVAAGHLPDSAAFGQEGNAVIAGHRDTSFWPLRKIAVGDVIRIRGAHTYRYVVRKIQIVQPEDVAVLRAVPGQSTLTIVTCYPFRYFGSAPQRFIVQAVKQPA